jgi:hypothetical protein
MINVAVIYIFRGADINNVKYLNDFQKAIKKYRSGIEFQLIVAIKGCSVEQEEIVKRTLSFSDPIFFHCVDHNFDIGTYQEILQKFKYENFIMMNSSSRPLADNWILEMFKAINVQNTGLVGTMGSYESLAVKNLHGTISNKDNFNLFPNPHVRTTGFIIKRDIFNGVTKNIKNFRNKMDAYKFESGKKNLTKEILELGLKVLIINSEFKLFEINDWKRSKTFRQFNQEKLLIMDKISSNYEKMSDNLKFIKTIQTWGDSILDIPGSIEELNIQDYRKIKKSSSNYG